MTRTLVARLDSLGDVLLTGPLVRAAAARGRQVMFLCSPAGAGAADLLPGVDTVEVVRAPWIEADPPPMTELLATELVARVRGLDVSDAIISTSFHQSALPLAALLRMAGVARIGAISEDYPGSLLDVRHRVDPGLHEVERNRSLGAACGYPPPEGDDGRLAIADGCPTKVDVPDRFVVVHPGASVPARTWDPAGFRALVELLVARGRAVVVTGGPDEAGLSSDVAGPHRPAVVDLGGRLSLPELAAVLARADCLVVGNTGPAHLAAAVGTPVVSIFPPTVPASTWGPWGVPVEVLGDQSISCGGCRARDCPRPGHPCVQTVSAADVVAAIDRLAHRTSRQRSPEPTQPASALHVAGAVR